MENVSRTKSRSRIAHSFHLLRGALAVLALCAGQVGGKAESNAAGVSDIMGRQPGGSSGLLPNISAIGTKRFIFFRARFPDDKEDPISQEEAAQTLQEVNKTFTRISDGKFRLDWEVSSVLPLTKGREEYNGPGGFDRFIEDVRQAGLAVGYDYRAYDLDVVRHSGVSDFRGGNANLGFRGAQVQAPGSTVIVHELGHNLGLSHANLWVTGTPGLSAASPPLPSNYESLPDARTIPVYPDSALGHESIVGPGYSAEYGDSSDIMGSGDREFSAVFRHQLGWLSDADIADARDGVTTNRIQSTDATIGTPGLARALRAGRPFLSPLGPRQIWVQLPPSGSSTVELPGVQLRWEDVSDEPRESLLLMPAASTPDLTGGTVLLAPGRAFSDNRAGVHITLLDAGGTGQSRWADVVVYCQPNNSNRPPSVNLSSSIAAAAIDELVSFSAVAGDPDNDTLVWHWDFGDGTTSITPVQQSKAWRRAGDFVVALEVSDKKGGVARAHVAVRVGEPKSKRITGRVLDPAGQPVPGVRVHNGAAGPTDPRRPLVTCFTDSLGRYTLAGLDSGTFTNGAFSVGYSIARIPPVTVKESDVSNIDFVATPLPQVSVSAIDSVPESIGPTNLFLFARTGATDEPLTVFYRLGGTATGGRDYVRPLVDRVVIPAGARTATLLLDVQDDAAAEDDETITVDVSYPSSMGRRDAQGTPFTVYYPGFELVIINGEPNWVLTEPSYVPGPSSSATVTIQDNDKAEGPQTLTANLLGPDLLQLTLQGGPSTVLVLESKTGSNPWTPVSTNVLSRTGAALVQRPIISQSHALYRTVRY